MGETRVGRHLGAPPERVYRALTSADDVVRWKVPGGMTSRVHHFEGWEGGTFRVSLTYDATDRQGKTAAHTDTYRGRFERLVPGEMVVEVDEFETDDPAFRGAMTITVTLSATADGGTDLLAVHEGLPPGVAPADNELGWTEALARLAALVESPGISGTA
ncbi:hypothetical protein EKO23_12560 [Nocardioides guangzhouensis]|uniref:Activator of Hsp90 ATPase homologue 1/2-like C-terminal domain-containing protein n=1 Tax=Nocardioides guangzhouensis TaxID=2497878 RepID=A0A4Q4ZCX5_9ACTN|nr:SRPBCC family protein [Nocardioides guangzhouensis]RYP85578.1 hypothetical protein EKO23_12560 [Nocardioides guangzhouensis]